MSFDINLSKLSHIDVRTVDYIVFQLLYIMTIKLTRLRNDINLCDVDSNKCAIVVRIRH